MKITITEPNSKPLAPYAHSISMVIRSFKGRRNVEVHLFRSSWSASMEESIDWSHTLYTPKTDIPVSKSSRNVVMESFTLDERNRIINYLKEQYSTRLTAIHSTPLSFPVPDGLMGLSQAVPNKNLGVIEFKKIPSYPLNIPLKGLYDLSKHPPLIEE
ncbi:hypothetical protein [Pseudodesulfovibrio piezophilus]|uniref:Uncharacterized protein n=1 Tax=Pseudodesulfovibrio piezophilus (strain DSM 21447 / JCM 15486 / C1TLV30) TaxID=1322246 RepID=M1WUM0_PSEP2|nr:hypothetical protein [Pseudodesulfovibrio piezophilus]CCH47573.1 conserved protein of unknown function [Pseudodesulfovibrio piezophilus C1TLV30]